MEWRAAPHFPDYEVREDGAVRRAAPSKGATVGALLTPQEDASGRLDLNLRRDGRYVHVKVARLVCEAWHGPPPSPELHCCHNDGNNQNNHWRNLRWDTHTGNMADMVKHGTRLWGERGTNARLTAAQVEEIRARYGPGITMRELGAEYGVGRQQIGRIVRGKRWRDPRLSIDASAG